MAIDPTGMATAVAAIQVGALSERQQRIATGLALIRDGKPIKRAAIEVGIPESTMWRYAHGVSKVESADADGMDADLRTLNEASFDVALIAAEAVRDELVNNRDAWKPADLVRAYSAATDRVISLNQRSNQPQNQQTSLASLLQGLKLTVEASDPSSQAIEAEVERVG